MKTRRKLQKYAREIDKKKVTPKELLFMKETHEV